MLRPGECVDVVAPNVSQDSVSRTLFGPPAAVDVKLVVQGGCSVMIARAGPGTLGGGLIPTILREVVEPQVVVVHIFTLRLVLHTSGTQVATTEHGQVLLSEMVAKERTSATPSASRREWRTFLPPRRLLRGAAFQHLIFGDDPQVNQALLPRLWRVIQIWDIFFHLFESPLFPTMSRLATEHDQVRTVGHEDMTTPGDWWIGRVYPAPRATTSNWCKDPEVIPCKLHRGFCAAAHQHQFAVVVNRRGTLFPPSQRSVIVANWEPLIGFQVIAPHVRKERDLLHFLSAMFALATFALPLRPVPTFAAVDDQHLALSPTDVQSGQQRRLATRWTACHRSVVLFFILFHSSCRRSQVQRYERHNDASQR
mmetsp:Transcript_136197/g.322726  ORF Transcript_136197/g.322726 Transcript_136197/m.322726 type:complete len:367 (-) Transcript_136197:56-1156(-)